MIANTPARAAYIRSLPVTKIVATRCELTQETIAVHGHAATAKLLKKSKVPFAIAYFLMFGRAPRPMPAQHPVARKLMARYIAS